MSAPRIPSELFYGSDFRKKEHSPLSEAKHIEPYNYNSAY